jgi:hypothetical protein
MKRTVTAVGTTLGALGALGVMMLTTSLAHAQQQSDLGQKGQFIISADRLIPFFAFSHQSEDGPTGNGVTKNVATQSQSSLSFFYGNTTNQDLFYTVPRLGVDYTIVPNVTIGGEIVLFFTLGGSSGTETDTSNGNTVTTSTSSPSTTIFGIAPRGGYILGLNNMFSLWLRGGFSFYTESTKTVQGNNNNNVTTTDSVHQWSIDLDPQFVITPFPHFAFTAGLTMDIPFGGSSSTETATGGTTTTFSAGSSDFYLGVTLGMLAHF